MKTLTITFDSKDLKRVNFISKRLVYVAELNSFLHFNFRKEITSIEQQINSKALDLLDSLIFDLINEEPELYHQLFKMFKVDQLSAKQRDPPPATPPPKPSTPILQHPDSLIDSYKILKENLMLLIPKSKIHIAKRYFSEFEKYVA